MDDYIVSIDVVNIHKQLKPSKHYVFEIIVEWSNKKVCHIYRRYNTFFELQSKLLDRFEDSTKHERILPYLPGKILFGRSHIKQVALERMPLINDYCKKLIQLPPKYSRYFSVLDFFRVNDNDVNFEKQDNVPLSDSEICISEPMKLKTCYFIEDYSHEKTVFSKNTTVSLIEKNLNGWCLVEHMKEQYWIPYAFLASTTPDNEQNEFRLDKPEEHVVVFDYKSTRSDELSLTKGTRVFVYSKNYNGWWKVLYNNQHGLAPANCLKQVDGSTEFMAISQPTSTQSPIQPTTTTTQKPKPIRPPPPAVTSRQNGTNTPATIDAQNWSYTNDQVNVSTSNWLNNPTISTTTTTKAPNSWQNSVKEQTNSTTAIHAPSWKTNLNQTNSQQITNGSSWKDRSSNQANTNNNMNTQNSANIPSWKVPMTNTTTAQIDVSQNTNNQPVSSIKNSPGWKFFNEQASHPTTTTNNTNKWKNNNQAAQNPPSVPSWKNRNNQTNTSNNNTPSWVNRNNETNTPTTDTPNWSNTNEQTNISTISASNWSNNQTTAPNWQNSFKEQSIQTPSWKTNLNQTNESSWNNQGNSSALTTAYWQNNDDSMTNESNLYVNLPQDNQYVNIPTWPNDTNTHNWESQTNISTVTSTTNWQNNNNQTTVLKSSYKQKETDTTALNTFNLSNDIYYATQEYPGYSRRHIKLEYGDKVIRINGSERDEEWEVKKCDTNDSGSAPRYIFKKANPDGSKPDLDS